MNNLEVGQKVILSGAGIEIDAEVTEVKDDGFKFKEIVPEGQNKPLSGFYSYNDTTIYLDDLNPSDELIDPFIDNGSPDLSINWTLVLILWVILSAIGYILIF